MIGRFAGLLVVGATVLLLSIIVGTGIGDRAIISADGKGGSMAVDLPTPVPVGSYTAPPSSGKWKKSRVVVAATDPAFPDPRFTPTPTPSPKPTPKPTPNGTPDGSAPEAELTDTPPDAFPIKPNSASTHHPPLDDLGE
jgi:hypothetical protein